MTKVIIICAGEGSRWGDFLGIPKHLIEIDGESLLERAIRLLKNNNISEIYVVSKNDPRYNIEGSIQYVARTNTENLEADKFLSSKELWNKFGRTIVLFGDCYFSDEAIKTIVNDTKKDWTLFCRPWRSEITGCPYGESFAQSFYPEDHERHEDCLYKVIDLERKGKIRRSNSWAHFKMISGLFDDNVVEDGAMADARMYIIDDWTEDFDTSSDYIMWISRRKGGHPTTRDRSF